MTTFRSASSHVLVTTSFLNKQCPSQYQREPPKIRKGCLLMQQMRPSVQAPLARPPSRMQDPLSAQIPVSLLGEVQLVKATNDGVILAIETVNRVHKSVTTFRLVI